MATNNHEQQLRQFLNRIMQKDWSYEDYLRSQDSLQTEEYPPEGSPTADDWQRFARAHIHSIGGKTVKDSGLTNEEFLEYIKSGYRPCAEHHDSWYQQPDGTWHWVEDRW